MDQPGHSRLRLYETIRRIRHSPDRSSPFDELQLWGLQWVLHFSRGLTRDEGCEVVADAQADALPVMLDPGVPVSLAATRFTTRLGAHRRKVAQRKELEKQWTVRLPDDVAIPQPAPPTELADRTIDAEWLDGFMQAAEKLLGLALDAMRENYRDFLVEEYGLEAIGQPLRGTERLADKTPATRRKALARSRIDFACRLDEVLSSALEAGVLSDRELVEKAVAFLRGEIVAYPIQVLSELRRDAPGPIKPRH